MTGSVCSATAAFAVCQPTPNSAAAEAIERSSTLTRSARRLRARSVSAARGAICSQRSDHVVTAQSPSGHRQRRLAHTNTVGRPEIAKSRTAVRDRPCPIARVPHSAQPTTSAVVSTYSHHSPSISSCAPTTNPGMPTSAVAPWLPCITVKGLSFCRCRNPQNREALGRAGGPYEPGPNLTRPHTPSRRAGYDETGLSLLDAVYSVNANYETTTRKVIERYRDNRAGQADNDTAEDLIDVIDRSGGPEAFAAEVVRNRQRTSTRNGILKSEAVHQLAGLLTARDAATKAQVEKLSPEQLKELEAAWRSVRGQRSGITWRYFLMLLGVEGVKPDRMIIRFIARTIGRRPSPDAA